MLLPFNAPALKQRLVGWFVDYLISLVCGKDIRYLCLWFVYMICLCIRVRMSNIVVPVLSVTVGLFFVLVGTIKLTPFISEEFYREMVGFCGSRAELQTSFPRPF